MEKDKVATVRKGGVSAQADREHPEAINNNREGCLNDVLIHVDASGIQEDIRPYADKMAKDIFKILDGHGGKTILLTLYKVVNMTEKLISDHHINTYYSAKSDMDELNERIDQMIADFNKKHKANVFFDLKDDRRKVEAYFIMEM